MYRGGSVVERSNATVWFPALPRFEGSIKTIARFVYDKWNVMPRIFEGGGRYLFAAYFAPSMKLLPSFLMSCTYCLLASPSLWGLQHKIILGHFRSSYNVKFGHLYSVIFTILQSRDLPVDGNKLVIRWPIKNNNKRSGDKKVLIIFLVGQKIFEHFGASRAQTSLFIVIFKKNGSLQNCKFIGFTVHR